MKKRILSAIVMIIIFIPILLIGGKAFVVLTSLLAAMGLYELLKLRSNENKVPLFMRLCSYLILIIICTRNISSLDFNYTLDYKMISLIIFPHMNIKLSPSRGCGRFLGLSCYS